MRGLKGTPQYSCSECQSLNQGMQDSWNGPRSVLRGGAGGEPRTAQGARKTHTHVKDTTTRAVGRREWATIREAAYQLPASPTAPSTCGGEDITARWQL